MATRRPAAATGQAEGKDGHNNGTPARQRRSVVGDIMDIMDLGEQVWKGSFSACFSGNYGGALERDGEARAASGAANKPRDGRGDTEWALKMALTYAGQDPLQVWLARIGIFVDLVMYLLLLERLLVDSALLLRSTRSC